MSVSREDVHWAYRMLLGREPESDAVVDQHMEFSDRDALRKAFLDSEEFRLAKGTDGASPVGRFQHVKTIAVEVDCSAEQRSRMMDHIAAEWRKYGTEVPHWSVITGEEFKPEHIAQNIEKFYATGRGHAADMLNPLSRAGFDVSHFGRVMDFGCGVGRLTLALAPIAGEIFGVDISPPHLALARERAGDGSNAQFISVDTVDDIKDLGLFDLVVSFIALQHNPPPVIAEILRNLLHRLAQGGFIIIQIPTYIDGYAFEADAYLLNPPPGIVANVLPQHVILQIFSECGCDLVEIREDNLLGGPTALSHTFAARKR